MYYMPRYRGFIYAITCMTRECSYSICRYTKYATEQADMCSYITGRHVLSGNFIQVILTVTAYVTIKGTSWPRGGLRGAEGPEIFWIR